MTFSKITDKEIINLYKTGDQTAFKYLIERYSSSLFNFTARLTNKNNAEDIVQEAWIKAWKNINKFDEEKASFKTWLFTIAKNTVTDFLRKKKSLLFSDIGNIDGEDFDSFSENIKDKELLPDEVLQKLEDIQILNNALDKLSLENKEILILHYQEDMTFDEIGKVLQKPLNTIKSKHRRAILELKKYI